MVKRIATFQEFWTFYLGEHRHRISRGLHAVGTAGFLIALGAGLVFLPGRTGVAWAYGWAWTGHLGFERHRPATVRYPFWSLVADLRLFARTFGGRS